MGRLDDSLLTYWGDGLVVSISLLRSSLRIWLSSFVVCAFIDAIYLHAERIKVWKALDPTHSCPSVNRNDLETMASALAASHGCDF